MGARVELYRGALREVDDVEVYLAAHSGLPGPRGNIELAMAAAEELDHAVLERLARSDDEFEAFCGVVVRQALGYCWSVAIAADPVDGLPAFARWRGSPDPDVAWVVRENLGKARLERVLAARP